MRNPSCAWRNRPQNHRRRNCGSHPLCCDAFLLAQEQGFCRTFHFCTFRTGLVQPTRVYSSGARPMFTLQLRCGGSHLLLPHHAIMHALCYPLPNPPRGQVHDNGPHPNPTMKHPDNGKRTPIATCPPMHPCRGQCYDGTVSHTAELIYSPRGTATVLAIPMLPLSVFSAVTS